MKTRVLLVLTLALAACAGPNESSAVSFDSVCALTSSCTFAAKCDAQYIGVFQFDASAATEFWMPVQMSNRLPSITNTDTGQVSNQNAHVTRFDITYTNFPLASASWSTNQLVPSNGTAVIGVEVVPPQAALLPAPAAAVQVLAKVVAHGFFDSGAAFETGEFPVAFTYCDGCLAVPVCGAGTPPVGCGSYGTSPSNVTCGGGGSGSTTFSIGGSIQGLTGSGLVLTLFTPGGLPDVSVKATDKSFVFSSQLADGTKYDVRVLSNPAGQSCTVSNGSGTVNGTSVSSITVTCA
jgi:hypothetical protein